MRENRNEYKIFIRKPEEGKKSSWKTKTVGGMIILKWIFKERDREGVNWTYLAQNKNLS
jgi:hypothetical protein